MTSRRKRKEPRNAIRDGFIYDVYVAHAEDDRLRAEKIARRIAASGLEVWFSGWQKDLESSEATEARARSRVMVLCLSAGMSLRESVRLESETYSFRDPTQETRRFIPIQFDRSPLPDSYRSFACVDLSRNSRSELRRLIAACQPAATPSEASPDAAGEKLIAGQIGTWCGALTVKGNRALSGSRDGTISLWDLATESRIGTMGGHTEPVICIAIGVDGDVALSGSHDRTVCIWDLKAKRAKAKLLGHERAITAVALSADCELAFSASTDRTLRVWNVVARNCNQILEHTCAILAVAYCDKIGLCVTGDTNHDVRIWNLERTHTPAFLRGHTGEVMAVAVAKNGTTAASGAKDTTVRVWDLKSNSCVVSFEGHTGPVLAVAISADGKQVVSSAEDRSVRVWDVSSGKCVNMFANPDGIATSLTLDEQGGRVLAVTESGAVRSWRCLAHAPVAVGDGIKYTNAKVLLVGDSGVGKSGLAMRLTENRFKPVDSTDAAWATQMKLTDVANDDGVEREIWLWDFAGQADYRLVHQLYMDETALAVLVFNPQHERLFDGIDQWITDLKRAARRSFKILLVAGRIDVGSLMVSRDLIEAYRREKEFARYIETSAKSGAGCDELRRTIIGEIEWQDIPWTASPKIFRLLKEQIVRLKDQGIVLLRIIELKQRLDVTIPDEAFTISQLRAVVGLLAGPGIVWQLGFGDFVLLQPELINTYAAAVIRTVRNHDDEIGCIREEDVLAGKLDFHEMKRLPESEEQIVLRAMHQLFVGRSLCLREPTERGTFLIFPSFFKRERPPLEDNPQVLVTYQFSGSADEIYATLVVRLHHTTAFEHPRLWRFACDFKTQGGPRAGLRLIRGADGTAELEIYFEQGISDDVKVSFIRYIHVHLTSKALNVQRIRHFTCPHCGKGVHDSGGVAERLRDGRDDILCVRCERRVPLNDLIEQKFASEETKRRALQLEEEAKQAIDNESRELILVGHTTAIVGEAGQIFRPVSNSDHGIDGEIEFKDDAGKATGKRLYVQLKSGDSYLRRRKDDGTEVFLIRKPRHATYWRQQAYPVMLVIRTSDGKIRWMNVTEYLERNAAHQLRHSWEVLFTGEDFTAPNVRRMRELVLSGSRR